jgi:methylmalonyl-CoA epimerase
MPIKNINHIAVIVPDIDEALEFWRDTLGLKLERVEEIHSQDVEVAFLPLGQGKIELVRPTDQDSGAARLLANRGAGLHHIALEVEDLKPVLVRLKEKGVRLINENPISASGGRRAVFVHPESASGVLIELYDSMPE